MAWSFDSPGITATVFLDGEPPLPGLIELEEQRGGAVWIRFRDGSALLTREPFRVWVKSTGVQDGPAHE